MIRTNELTSIYNSILGCTYAVGKTDDGRYTYIWTERDMDTEEIPLSMIENTDAYHGAMVGSLEDIVEEIETCVGSFRHHGDEEQQEAAWEVVEELLSAFGLESQFGTKY